MDTQGLMSLQFMMPSQPGGASGFVELLVRPLFALVLASVSSGRQCVPVDDEE
jgi:hypothetical protein